MNSHELTDAVVKVVGALAEVEVNNADGIHFLDVAVGVTQLDVLCYGFCCSIKDTLQIIHLARQLNFHDEDFPKIVLRLDVHAVVLVVETFLVALTLQ